MAFTCTVASSGHRRMRAVFALCVALQPCSVSAAGGTIWHVHEYELNFIESVTLICLVALALIFEVSWHFLSHSTHHSYFYGQLHESLSNDDHNHHRDGIHHVRLFKELNSRMGGEFMSLGFLAFSIFASNQLGFFEMLAESFPPCEPHSASAASTSIGSSASADDSCWHMPQTASDWLYMAEVVHVKLFLAMMLYFVLITGLVRGSVRKIKNWERLRLRHIVDTQRHTLDTELRDYRIMRDYFLQRVYSWKRTRPGFFREVLEVLGVEEGLVNTKCTIQQLMDEKFVLSAYLSLNVERVVRDSIEVSTFTWASIIVLFGLCAVAHRFLHWTILDMTPFFVLIAICILVSMVMLSRWMRRSIHNYMKLDPASADDVVIDPSSPAARRRSYSNLKAKGQPDRFDFAEGLHGNLTISGRFSLDTSVLRVLQLLMFMISYAFSRTIADKNDWTQFAVLTLLSSTLFALLFMSLLHVIPKYVPKFLELMAFPPFVDAVNLNALFAVLTTDHYNPKKKIDVSKNGSSTPRRQSSDDALTAVSELATLIGNSDAANLGAIQLLLKDRMEDRGVHLPVPSVHRKSDLHASVPAVKIASNGAEPSVTLESRVSLPTQQFDSLCYRVTHPRDLGLQQQSLCEFRNNYF
eukprot:TRINITY_DN22043_c0_g2_i1.p1 TRINITY_DN22043_c0_g2~~TRINITY_DN22043_c0_g2_i1.p1  ORF type:complete len:639 (+),score=54.03 TRINITY_DN22043_c0_g2_i1:92-2008(+)